MESYDFRMNAIAEGRRLYEVVDPSGFAALIFRIRGIFHPYLLEATKWKACHDSMRDFHNRTCDQHLKLNTKTYKAAQKKAATTDPGEPAESDFEEEEGSEEDDDEDGGEDDWEDEDD